MEFDTCVGNNICKAPSVVTGGSNVRESPGKSRISYVRSGMLRAADG